MTQSGDVFGVTVLLHASEIYEINVKVVKTCGVQKDTHAHTQACSKRQMGSVSWIYLIFWLALRHNSRQKSVFRFSSIECQEREGKTKKRQLLDIRLWNFTLSGRKMVMHVICMRKQGSCFGLFSGFFLSFFGFLDRWYSSSLHKLVCDYFHETAERFGKSHYYRMPAKYYKCTSNCCSEPILCQASTKRIQGCIPNCVMRTMLKCWTGK